MPPEKGGMVRSAAILLSMAIAVALPWAMDTQGEIPSAAIDSSLVLADQSRTTSLTAEQQELVNWAIARSDRQGLELPEVAFVFHDDLFPCNGHKGLYHRSKWTLEMCSMDPITMLHELAHAWANESLTDLAKEDFLRSRHLPSWNNHNIAWEDRGTEHVAETIAWALAEDPHHVKWVETLRDGTTQTTHRILTLGIDVDTLLDNFKFLTGMDPVFRQPAEWTVDETATTPMSPELARLGA